MNITSSSAITSQPGRASGPSGPSRPNQVPVEGIVNSPEVPETGMFCGIPCTARTACISVSALGGGVATGGAVAALMAYTTTTAASTTVAAAIGSAAAGTIITGLVGNACAPNTPTPGSTVDNILSRAMKEAKNMEKKKGNDNDGFENESAPTATANFKHKGDTGDTGRPDSTDA